MNFNTIPEALEDLRQGKIILVTDDPDRENEGDFICAAEFATTENINFMATCSRCCRRKTACWSGRAIRRPPWTCAVWRG